MIISLITFVSLLRFRNKKKEKEKKKLTIEVKRILENIPKEATITNDSNNDCTMAKLSSKKNEEKMVCNIICNIILYTNHLKILSYK